MTSIYLLKDDKVLLLFRKDGRVVSDVWTGSAGGHFEEFELNDAKACVLREMNEELGLCEDNIRNLSLRYVTLRRTKGEIRQNYYFFAILNEEVSDDLVSNEGELKWFSLNKLDELEMPYTARYVMDHYCLVGQYSDKIYTGVANENERIVFERASRFVVGVDSDIVDSDILEALKSEGIIVESRNKIRLKYDIFEDICFERYIDKAFDACHGSYNVFFDEIEKIGRCIYRRYQIWISNKLFVQEAREKFVYTLLTDNSIEAKWKKQTEIGIVKSKYCGLFFKEFQELLDETVVEELLDITNLYAFEAKINHSPALIMNVTPIGAARENLIGRTADQGGSSKDCKKQ